MISANLFAVENIACYNVNCINVLPKLTASYNDFKLSVQIASVSMEIRVKRMQRSGTEAIRNQIRTSKPKRENTNISNSQNTKRT